MVNLTINSFLKDLSSISPLTSDFEANIVVLCTYINLLQKNTANSVTRNTSENKIKLEKFVDVLNKNSKIILEKYHVSNDFINKYMVAMKMPKNTQEEIVEYENLLNSLNVSKANEFLTILEALNEITTYYIECSSSQKEDFLKSNELCISNIQSIKNYMVDLVKNIVSEIEDTELIFDILQKIKNI